MSEKLSDNQVHDALHAAIEALGERDATTVRGRTALEAARKALRLLQAGLVFAMVREEEKEGSTAPASSSPNAPQPPSRRT